MESSKIVFEINRIILFDNMKEMYILSTCLENNADYHCHHHIWCNNLLMKKLRAREMKQRPKVMKWIRNRAGNRVLISTLVFFLCAWH